jgi:hypothetical protein
METQGPLAPLERVLEWVQTFASKYADPEEEASVRALLRQCDPGQVMVDFQQGFARLFHTPPPDLEGFEKSGPLGDALRLLLDWESLSRDERLSGLGAAIAGLQWFGERHWPGSTLPHRRTAVVAVQLNPFQVQQGRSVPLRVGPLTVVPTIHLHLLFKSYRLFCTDLGNLRAQADTYSRYLLASVEALPAPDDLCQAAPPISHGAETAGQGEVGVQAPPDKVTRPVVQVTERLRAIARAWRAGRAEDSVRQAFCRVLERPAEEAAVLSLAAMLADGTTEREVMRGLVFSEEHLQQFVGLPNTEASIQKLYDHIFSRPIDGDGMDHYMAKWQAGGLETVAEAMLDSDEYIERFGDYKIPGEGRLGSY